MRKKLANLKEIISKKIEKHSCYNHSDALCFIFGYLGDDKLSGVELAELSEFIDECLHNKKSPL